MARHSDNLNFTKKPAVCISGFNRLWACLAKLRAAFIESGKMKPEKIYDSPKKTPCVKGKQHSVGILSKVCRHCGKRFGKGILGGTPVAAQ